MIATKSLFMKSILPIIATTIFISTLTVSWLVLPSSSNYMPKPSYLTAMESGKDTAHLYSEALEAVVVNNAAYGKTHRAKYNGVSELRIKGDSMSNPFVST